MARHYSRPYVGLKAGTREPFRAITTPTEISHPQYSAVIGPFRTMRGARFMATSGYANPHCVTVRDAERLARPPAREADFLINDQGTIVLLTPQSEAAKAWATEHIHAEPWQMFGPAYAIDHRFAQAILDGIEADGLTVEG